MFESSIIKIHCYPYWKVETSRERERERLVTETYGDQNLSKARNSDRDGERGTELRWRQT